jgi:hypothetical protein
LQGKYYQALNKSKNKKPKQHKQSNNKKKKQYKKLGTVHRQKARPRKVVMAGAWKGGLRDEMGIKMVSVF